MVNKLVCDVIAEFQAGETAQQVKEPEDLDWIPRTQTPQWKEITNS